MAAAPLLNHAEHRQAEGADAADQPDVCPNVAARLKDVLRGLPGPVALITTRDPRSGQPAGLAASAVVPVSMAPPSMLVCVNRSASAHAVIEVSGRFCINLIGASQTGLVSAFSSSAQRSSRFAVGAWDERHGLPYLPASSASIFCIIRTTLLFGTHEAFVGEVFDLICYNAEKPIGWVDGAFAHYVPASGSQLMPADTDARELAKTTGA